MLNNFSYLYIYFPPHTLKVCSLFQSIGSLLRYNAMEQVMQSKNNYCQLVMTFLGRWNSTFNPINQVLPCVCISHLPLVVIKSEQNLYQVSNINSKKDWRKMISSSGSHASRVGEVRKTTLRSTLQCLWISIEGRSSIIWSDNNYSESEIVIHKNTFI